MLRINSRKAAQCELGDKQMAIEDNPEAAVDGQLE